MSPHNIKNLAYLPLFSFPFILLSWPFPPVGSHSTQVSSTLRFKWDDELSKLKFSAIQKKFQFFENIEHLHVLKHNYHHIIFLSLFNTVDRE